MTKKRTKRQHFVPRFYLNNFTDDNGFIWTYDNTSSNPATTAFSASPENTAFTTNFYSIYNESGEYDNSIEDVLASIESEAAPIYNNMIDGQLPTGSNKNTMAVFFATMFARSPAQVNRGAWLMGALTQLTAEATISNRERFERSMDDMESSRGMGKTTKAERDNMFKFMNDKDSHQMVVLQKSGLYAMAVADEISKIFDKMNWILLSSKHRHLITSDNPVTNINPNRHPIFGGGGFIARDVFVTIPLSPSMLIEMTWHKPPRNTVYPADRERAKLYNRQRAAFAERYVYSSRMDAGLGALITKHRGQGPKFHFGGPKLSEIIVRRKID